MRFSLMIVTAAAVLTAPMGAEGMNDRDRQRLLAHLEMTEGWLASELDGWTAG